MDWTQADRGITLSRLAHLFHLGCDFIGFAFRSLDWIVSHFSFFFFFKEHWFIVKLDITVFQSSIKYVYF